MAKRPSARAAQIPPEGSAPARRGAPKAALETPIHPAPLELDAVLGQDRAVRILRSAVQSGRLHHAWIFHGPAGVGKFTTALAFGALLLDPAAGAAPLPAEAGGLWGDAPDPRASSPDTQDSIRRLLHAGAHPDLHIIRKELAAFSDDSSVRDSKLITIPKDVVDTHLIRPAQLAPTLRNDALASKVFIVDEAELLDRSPSNAPTQNAILKTMEEPEGRTVIILVTSSEDRLLPTIRSRSQRVGFACLDGESMRAWLTRPEAEPVRALGEPEQRWILDFAQGSPGVALDATRAGVHELAADVAPLLARVRAGTFLPELGAALAAFAENYAESFVKAHPHASKESANRDGAAWVFRLLLHEYARALRAGSQASEQSRCAAAIDHIREAERLIDTNVSHAFVMEELAAELASA